MSEAGEHLCASAELEERGQAYVWDVMQYRRPARAFALRFDGRAVAYLNRCVHVPTEMDWQPGEYRWGRFREVAAAEPGASNGREG